MELFLEIGQAYMLNTTLSGMASPKKEMCKFIGIENKIGEEFFMFEKPNGEKTGTTKLQIKQNEKH